MSSIWLLPYVWVSFIFIFCCVTLFSSVPFFPRSLVPAARHWGFSLYPKQMKGLREMTSELQPHTLVRMPKYLQALIMLQPSTRPPICFSLQVFELSPVVAAFCCSYVYSTSCLGRSHVIDLPVKLGSLITVISLSRSALGLENLITSTTSLFSPHCDQPSVVC